MPGRVDCQSRLPDFSRWQFTAISASAYPFKTYTAARGSTATFLPLWAGAVRGENNEIRNKEAEPPKIVVGFCRRLRISIERLSGRIY
jgi:hypothetical protein